MYNKNTFGGNYLLILQITIFTAVLMYFGRSLFIPLTFSWLIALILYPPCLWLEKRKWPRSIAITTLLLLLIVLFAGIVWLILWQLNYLVSDIPQLMQKLKVAIQELEQWFNQNFGISWSTGTSWFEKMSTGSGMNLQSIIQGTIENTGVFLFVLFLVPVFTALFLYHREQFVNFLKAIIPSQHHQRLSLVMHEASYAYSDYIIGLLKVYVIVGILNSAGLMLLGIENAILFGMLTSFMTMVPYVGIIISSLLPITVAWVTKDSILYPLGVVAVFTFVQYLENSVIFPKVVGQQLNVSTWTILVALLAGGLLWGVSGMVLFMPFVAILKIISDNIEEWKPLNILLSRMPRKKTIENSSLTSE
jgi:predicted PurR-regulated permease PerM